MDALIQREVAAQEASQAAASHAAAAAPISKPKKAKVRAVPQEEASTSAAASSWDGVVVKGDEDDDETDEEFAEHGAFVPDPIADPATAAAAEAGAGRRVYLEGLQNRRDLNGAAGTIIEWNQATRQWEVEMDRRDERVYVRSAKMRYLDQAPRPKAKKAKAKETIVKAIEKSSTSQKSGKKKKKRKTSMH